MRESDAYPKPTLGFRNPRTETDDPVNRARAFSGTGEKSGGREKNRAHRGGQTFSPHAGAENGTVSKWFALLGILREEVLKE